MICHTRKRERAAFIMQNDIFLPSRKLLRKKLSFCRLEICIHIGMKHVRKSFKLSLPLLLAGFLAWRRFVCLFVCIARAETFRFSVILLLLMLLLLVYRIGRETLKRTPARIMMNCYTSLLEMHHTKATNETLLRFPC